MNHGGNTLLDCLQICKNEIISWACCDTLKGGHLYSFNFSTDLDQILKYGIGFKHPSARVCVRIWLQLSKKDKIHLKNKSNFVSLITNFNSKV